MYTSKHCLHLHVLTDLSTFQLWERTPKNSVAVPVTTQTNAPKAARAFSCSPGTLASASPWAALAHWALRLAVGRGP